MADGSPAAAAASAGGAKIIDGKEVSNCVVEEVKAEVALLKEKLHAVPELAVVLVGDRKDSATYVRMKQQTAEKAGIKFQLASVPETISEADLLKLVEGLNANAGVDGIIVQLPLPAHISERRILDAISVEKDVDGFQPENIGKLALKGRDPAFIPCTPKGCMRLLQHYKLPTDGKHAVVLGRSNIVGTPAALLLLHANATVTICHSRTPNLKEVVQQADILIAAVGKTELVKGDWLKPGVVVIDVGTNAVNDPTKKAGYRLVGDVDFEQAKKVASWITPVPGGVGPMTVAMLLQATLVAFKRKHKVL